MRRDLPPGHDPNIASRHIPSTSPGAITLRGLNRAESPSIQSSKFALTGSSTAPADPSRNRCRYGRTS